MAKSFCYRNYKPDDEKLLFDLLHTVWGKKLEISEWEEWIKGWMWMFSNNPAGNSIIWLAEHNGKLVGSYPLIMLDMKIGNLQGKGGQIADTMTHPQYRRQGIAFTLGEKALAQLKEQKALLAFGFPTEEAYPLHMNSGWIDVCSIQTMVKPLNLGNILNKYLAYGKSLIDIFSKFGELPLKSIFGYRKPSMVDGLTISKISHFDKDCDDFWDMISKDFNIIVVRNRDYLNWRYVDMPNAKYTLYAAEKNKKLYGYMVLDYKYHNGLVFGRILDIVAPLDQEVIIQCLVSKAIEHFKQKKVDAIYSSIISSRYRHSFLKNGFIPFPRSNARLIAYMASPQISEGFLKNPKNWFIQLGDLPIVD